MHDMGLTDTRLHNSHPDVQKFKPTALKLSKAYVNPIHWPLDNQLTLGTVESVTEAPTGVRIESQHDLRECAPQELQCADHYHNQQVEASFARTRVRNALSDLRTKS